MRQRYAITLIHPLHRLKYEYPKQKHHNKGVEAIFFEITKDLSEQLHFDCGDYMRKNVTAAILRLACIPFYS